MIKNLIFDVDNTIVESSEKYAIYYKIALKNLGYDQEKYLELYNAIDGYEKQFDSENNLYNKKTFIDFINKTMNEEYSVKLVDEICNVIQNYWTDSIFLDRETLEYLAGKYNLYIYSNWFYDCIVNRLSNINYINYFKKVYSSDIYGSKPYENAFKKVLSDIGALPSECIMIGDSMRTDIAGAKNIGMQAIRFDYNSISTKKDCITISNLRELMEIL